VGPGELNREMPRFLVVTPTFQSEDYLDECIHSIVGQAGDFEVRYHIQDGGSTDETWAIIQRWQAALEANPGLFPCRVTLTAEQAPDAGMYDAISKAFAHLRPRAEDVMTWLNSDDLLATGAFKAVAGCMVENPSVALCGGRTALINAETRLDHVGTPMLRSQALMAAGLYDGRRLNFIMQEGTFWTGRLWKAVGGLDASFRLAGDWDLWRRMAEHAPYVVLDALTGFHRRRPGQLSGDIEAYHREVDRALTGEARERYDRTYKAYQNANPDSSNFDTAAFPGLVAVVEGEERAWHLKDVFGEPLPPPITISDAARSLVQRGEVVSGSRGAEGPYPDQGLPAGIRWIDAPEAVLHLPAAEAGHVRVRLTCRSGQIPCRVVLDSNGEQLLSAAILPQTPERDQILTFDYWASKGDNPLRLTTYPEEGNPGLRLLVVDLTYEPMALAMPESIHSVHGPAVVVVARDQLQGLWKTVRSLGTQSLKPSRITIVTDQPASRFEGITDAFPGVELVVADADALDLRAAEILVQAKAEFGMRLTAGQTLGPDAIDGALSPTDGLPVDVATGATLEIDDLQQGRRRFRNDADIPWLASRAAWRSLLDTPAVLSQGWPEIRARLTQAGMTTRDLPVTLDVVRGKPLRRESALRVLWLMTEDDAPSEAFATALTKLGAEVRCVILPPTRALARKAVRFHHQAWDPGMAFASPKALKLRGMTSDAFTLHELDEELAARLVSLKPQSDGHGGLLDLALTLANRAGNLESFRVVERSRQDPDLPRPEVVQDRFGAGVFGLAAMGPVDLSARWVAREGFGHGPAPAFVTDLPASSRWVQERRAEMAVYSPAAGRRRLVLWLRSPSENQRLIIRCGGRLVHECATGDRSMKQDQRLSMSVEMEMGWNDVTLEFSSVVTRAGQSIAAVITGADVKPEPAQPVGDNGNWSYVDGADYEEPAHPHLGLHRPFRWSLDPCILRLIPSVAGANQVTIRYQTAVAEQTLVAHLDGEVVGSNYVETSDISAIRVLSFNADLAAGGNDLRLNADRLLRDGRTLSVIIDGVSIVPVAAAGPSTDVLSRAVDMTRRLARRMVRAVGVLLRG